MKETNLSNILLYRIQALVITVIETRKIFYYVEDEFIENDIVCFAVLRLALRSLLYAERRSLWDVSFGYLLVLVLNIIQCLLISSNEKKGYKRRKEIISYYYDNRREIDIHFYPILCVFELSSSTSHIPFKTLNLNPMHPIQSHFSALVFEKHYDN